MGHALDLQRLNGTDLGGLRNLGGLREDMDDATLPELGSTGSVFVGDVPVPESLYVIGPGDVFQIAYESRSMEQTVNPQGNIILARIGILEVEGLTLAAANKLILEKLRTAYKRTECFVNLARPKTMKVYISGAVAKPGTYRVEGHWRLSDLLVAAEGFAVSAARESIRIISRRGDTQTVDLRRFLVEGDFSANPLLPQGALVQVPYLDYTRPYLTVRLDTNLLDIQLGKGESVMDILRKYHSFGALPLYNAVLIHGPRDSLVEPADFASRRPAAGDTLEIIRTNREVYVGGAVLRPGLQPYRSNHRLVNYLSEAGLITSSKVADRLLVVHADGRREILSTREGRLLPGDMVYVDQNTEQRFLLYTPILLSLASLTLAVINLFYLR